MTRQRCQCPLGLVPHCYEKGDKYVKETFKPCQCPLGLVPHCYYSRYMRERSPLWTVSMPSRASTSLLLGGSPIVITKKENGVNALSG